MMSNAVKKVVKKPVKKVVKKVKKYRSTFSSDQTPFCCALTEVGYWSQSRIDPLTGYEDYEEEKWDDNGESGGPVYDYKQLTEDIVNDYSVKSGKMMFHVGYEKDKKENEGLKTNGWQEVCRFMGNHDKKLVMYIRPVGRVK